MGTKTTTDQTNKFDPQALQAYQGMQGPLAEMLQGYMQNPFGNPFFQTQQQMGTRQAQNLGGTATSNLLRNMQSSGMFGGASSPAGLEMLQNQNRANTGLQANLGFLNPVQNALGMQQFAGGVASQYRPLQTGSNQTQSTSGLGTWLPQVLGAGMGIAGMAMGMPGLGGSKGGGGGSMWGPGSSAGWSGAGSPQMGNPPFQGFGSQAWNLGGAQGGPPPPQFGSTQFGGG